jgi:hypothetical protein
MDVSALLPGGALPFGPAAPHAPAIVPEPSPRTPAGPLFPEIPRPRPSGAAPPEAVKLDAPLAVLLTPEGEAPSTLGAFFLAAMARAGRIGNAPGASLPAR